MRAIEALREVTRTLEVDGIEPAWKEAEILVTHGAGLDMVKIYRDNPLISRERMAVIQEMVSRRKRREPLSYIIGHGEFMGLKLILKKGVLIPRPETELMAEYAINILRAEGGDSRRLKVLDLCTGSGCLALALARAFPEAHVYGIDISGVAVRYAKENTRVNRIENVRFIRGDLLNPLRVQGLFDLIISNPPYIKTADTVNLQPEIRDWEPLIALDGGEEGLAFYRQIIPDARVFLRDRGILILEVGLNQATEVKEMTRNWGYTEIEAVRDYAGVERIIKARWKG